MICSIGMIFWDECHYLRVQNLLKSGIILSKHKGGVVKWPS